MTKTKKQLEELDEVEGLEVIAPELHYLSAHYEVRIPAFDSHLSDIQKLSKYAEKLIEDKLGDEVQMASLKVRRPHLLAKSKAKLLKREPSARLLVTVKF